MLVIFWKGEDELEAIYDIPDMDVVPRARDSPGYIRVDGDLSPLHHGTQHPGDELLWVLSLSEYIHGVGHHNGHFISVLEGHGELLPSRLPSRVRIATVISVVLSIGHSSRSRTYQGK